jgi:phosphoglucosamine mutase
MASSPIRFGTDGVRGPYGQWPITVEGARTIGAGLASWLSARTAQSPRVLVGRDPRASGEALTRALLDGIVSCGGQAVDIGILPTAAVSCAVDRSGANAGVMVTASHNPAADNGIKVLGTGGIKLTKAEARALEGWFDRPVARDGGAAFSEPTMVEHWYAWLPQVDLSGLTVLVDAANGAASEHAPRALEAMGATVVRRGCAPDGQNINDGVGALHPPSAQAVRESGAHLAICLDGDADRVALVCPEKGLLDGDDLLWLMRTLSDGPIVGTVMSNGGLEEALAGRMVRCPVGDAHVAAAMREHQAAMGAEPSGHVLFSDGMPTGDGLYAALRVLEAARGPDGAVVLPLNASGWSRWPVEQSSVRFTGDRIDLSTLASLTAAREAGNRLVVRYSGTEPKLRILVEGHADAAGHVAAIVSEFQSRLASRP